MVDDYDEELDVEDDLDEEVFMENDDDLNEENNENIFAHLDEVVGDENIVEDTFLVVERMYKMVLVLV